MRRLLLVLVALSSALALPAPASAHPLGNFTVNRYDGIELAGRDVYVRYVLDLAEIPTYQLGDEIRSPGYGDRLAQRLELTLDGRRASLRAVLRRVTSRAGAGGLPTLRLEVVFQARGEGSVLGFRDGSFADRVGWREVTLRARDGARVLESSVPAASASSELRAYPRELLRSPLDVSAAAARVAFGTGSAPAPELGPSAAAPARSGGGLEALVERGDLSAGALLLVLVVAAFWGAAHALTPGHGKAMVAAYLVGTRGTAVHAFLLGGTVTIAHTAGVFALGIVTLGLSELIVPERLYPWLTLVSGLLVVAVGASVLRQRLAVRRHVHSPAHVHGRVHDHHPYGSAPTTRGILGVGMAAGVLPCPSALVVLLAYRRRLANRTSASREYATCSDSTTGWRGSRAGRRLASSSSSRLFSDCVTRQIRTTSRR